MNRCLGLLFMGIVSVACSQESAAGTDLSLPGDLGVPSDLAALPDDAVTLDQAMMDGGVTGPTLSLIAGGLGGRGSQDGLGAAARFNYPRGAALDGAGNLYLADSENGTIRKVVIATGAVTTLAGFPGAYGLKDGVGADARFKRPFEAVLDNTGNHG